MNSIKDILGSIPESGGQSSEEDLMLNPDYLRQSSSVISEALQKGFDVLQLENGDIVTTGTKVVIVQYHWDNHKGKMVKLSAKERKDQQARGRKKK